MWRCVKKMLTFHTWGCILITPKYAQVESGVLRRRLCIEHCACLPVAVSHTQLCSIFGRPRQGWSLLPQMSAIRYRRMTAGLSLKVSSTVTPSSLHLPNRSVGSRRYNTHETQFREKLQDDLPTGHCIALVEGAERTLAANLGAANKFSAEDLWQGNNRTMLEGAKVKPLSSASFLDKDFPFKVIYVEGYFLSHSPEATVELARW